MSIFVLYEPDGHYLRFLGAYSTYDAAMNAAYRYYRHVPLRIEERKLDQ